MKDFYFTSALSGGPFEVVPGALSPSGVSCRTLGHELRHPKQVVGRTDKPGLKLRSISTFEPCFSEAPGRLHPAEYLLHPLSYALARDVTFMAGSPAVNGRATFSSGILSHMGNNLPLPEHGDKTNCIIPLVPTKGPGLYSLSCLTLEHLLRGLPLGGPLAAVTLISTSRPLRFSIST